MNHGPDEKNAEGLGPDPDGLGAELGGLGDDELALRRMLHSVVDDIEPRSGSLERLRRAVPARRARKRQAVVGVAAAALFFGTAIPALVHVSDAGGTDPDTAMAGQSSQAQGGTGQDPAPAGGTSGKKGGGSASAEPGRQPGRTGEKGRSGGGATSSAGADPSATLSAGGAPVCKAAQLGSATGSAAAPDTAGVVYGTFQVTNTSSVACSVGGAGKVTPAAQGAADPAKIVTARHVAGDAATGLPDPSLEVSGLVLQPGAAYEEKFAFVPSQSCPTSGGSTATGGSTAGSTGGPSPDPTPTPQAGASGTAGSDTGGTTSGTTTQLGTEGGTAPGSVVVTHTAQGGSPTASATVPQACAGTVYYTGVLAGP